MKSQKDYWNCKWKEKAREGISRENSLAKKVVSLAKSKRAKTILDLGCGDGRDSLFFAKNGLKVTAIDFSEPSIKLLKNEIQKRNVENIWVVLKDISKGLKKFKKESFDIVYAHLSLHYFNDKKTTSIFKQLHRILKCHGLLIIKVKSTADALYGKGKKIEADFFDYKHVRHFFSKEYLAGKLKKFKIISIKRTGKNSFSNAYKASLLEAVAEKTCGVSS